mmetsp:Transcript_101115/g.286603  ORF Transcript_101115/g.286603 Transcript_101115/m.286603 type:complete len:532 (+) Transcript_101115:169-1764(+)
MEAGRAHDQAPRDPPGFHGPPARPRGDDHLHARRREPLHAGAGEEARRHLQDARAALPDGLRHRRGEREVVLQGDEGRRLARHLEQAHGEHPHDRQRRGSQAPADASRQGLHQRGPRRVPAQHRAVHRGPPAEVRRALRGRGLRPRQGDQALHLQHRRARRARRAGRDRGREHGLVLHVAGGVRGPDLAEPALHRLRPGHARARAPPGGVPAPAHREEARAAGGRRGEGREGHPVQRAARRERGEEAGGPGDARLPHRPHVRRPRHDAGHDPEHDVPLREEAGAEVGAGGRGGRPVGREVAPYVRPVHERRAQVPPVRRGDAAGPPARDRNVPHVSQGPRVQGLPHPERLEGGRRQHLRALRRGGGAPRRRPPRPHRPARLAPDAPQHAVRSRHAALHRVQAREARDDGVAHALPGEVRAAAARQLPLGVPLLPREGEGEHVPEALSAVLGSPIFDDPRRAAWRASAHCFSVVRVFFVWRRFLWECRALSHEGGRRPRWDCARRSGGERACTGCVGLPSNAYTPGQTEQKH